MSIDYGGYLPPPLFDEGLAASLSAAAAAAQNAARPATSTVQVTVTGSGQSAQSTPTPFGASYDSKPVFTYGIELANHDPRYAYPSATAGVYKWQVDAKGLYTGAYLYFHVDVTPHDVPVLQYAEMSARLNLGYQYAQHAALAARAGNGFYSGGYWWPPGVAQPISVAGSVPSDEKLAAAEVQLRLAQLKLETDRISSSYQVAVAEVQAAQARQALAKAVADNAAKTVTIFHLSFYGNALKTLPAALTDDSSPELPTYSPGFGDFLQQPVTVNAL